MAGERKRVALEIVSRIEHREAELLGWGVVDGAFEHDELCDLIEEMLGEHDPDGVFGGEPDAVLDALRDARLIYELPGAGGRHRSRMAEGVRLLYRLRQILPWRDWHNAQNLVADFRLLLAPRRYPRRHIALAAVNMKLADVFVEDTLEREVVQAIIVPDPQRPMALADFQVSAARRVLTEVAERRKSGTIVCAGTGSGKTLAFYLPALVALARWSTAERWTRCLSLYPRNELLKDQLGSALVQVRRVNAVLAAQGRRPLTVGALFGAVPTKPSLKQPPRGWSVIGHGVWRCPYLSCPGCEKFTLDWTADERARNGETLRCRCGVTVGPDLFALSRETMCQKPPDLLFTSLEMMNQRLSDPKLRRTLGLGQPRDRQPRLVLLDEVHTYDGVYGAQAVLLLRRWKQLTRATAHFVGLSATLADARRFFADFLSEREDLVQEISPHPDDMQSEGQEYMLALRGDPISQTSLLSTSIQVAMLLRRLLDRNDSTDGVYGSKVFAFTDNLDVINRLYHDLLDAEGWRLGYHGPVRKPPDRHRNARISEPWLAAHRASRPPVTEARRRAGQCWDLCEHIGHRLHGNDPPVRVGRTSSQDVGVDATADITVATSSLEIGYDDPRVGAVVQHKAPLSPAAFLQRKGRAGRPRGTRPWTVVVLSCYGRDRLAYESYDQLFSPSLRARHLPVDNRYVLRIQATYCLMDWLCQNFRIDGHVWQLLSQPPQSGYERWARPLLEAIRRAVERMLNDEREQRGFEYHLRYALGIDDETVQALMWEPPRSLMMAVLPTIARRLGREWTCAVARGEPVRHEAHRFWSPLPEFVPANLFSDLNLPEVGIPLGDERYEVMGVLQGLREFAPGRVTLRFGVAHRNGGLWIPVIPGDETVALDTICPPAAREELGLWRLREGDVVKRIRVVRPFELRAQPLPEDIGTASNAQLEWATELLAPPDAQTLVVTQGPWRAGIPLLSFYLHAHANPIESRRFAIRSSYVLKRSGQEDCAGEVEFVDAAVADPAARRVAFGYSVDVDALRIALDVPDALHAHLVAEPELLKGTRPAYFRDRLDAQAALGERSNVFQRQWLARIYLGALVLRAEQHRESLADAHVALLDRNLRPLEEVVDVIFRSVGGDADDNTRRGQLLDLVRAPEFRKALDDCSGTLWEPPDETWEPWLRRRYRATMVLALREAAQQLVPELDIDGVYPDIDAGVGEGADEAVWLSEATLGGGGIVEALHGACTRDPLRFFDLLDAALAPGDFEDIHSELMLLLGWLDEDSPRAEAVRSAIARVRAAARVGDAVDRQLELRRVLSSHGLRVSHPVMTALNARVLRPGSSPDTDRLLIGLMDRWHAVEARLGIEVEGLVFAYLCHDGCELDAALGGVVDKLGHTDPAQWRFDTVYSLLWPRGAAVRAQGLQAYNPYAPLPEADRLLVLGARAQQRREVALGSPDWQAALREALVEEGIAALTASLAQRGDLAAAVRALIVEPLDLGYLIGYPRVRGLVQEGSRLSLVIDVPEAVR